jgi:hypothetical protein
VQRSFLRDIRETLAGFDVVDLAAKVGGLSVLPQNANRIGRLGVAASVVASLRPNPDARAKMTAPQLAEWVNADELDQVFPAVNDDHYDDLFTEAFSFDGGPFTVFPGVMEDGTYIFRHVCDAIFRSPMDFPEEFREAVHRVMTAVLKLSDEIARRVALSRGSQPIGSPTGAVEVPPNHVLSAVAHAVSFSERELRDLLRRSFDAIAPLIAEAGELNVSGLDGFTLSSLPKPLLRYPDDLFVVVSPGSLFAALRDHVFGLIRAHGQEERFAVAYGWVVFRNVVWSLGLLGNEPTGIALPPIERLPLQEGIFSMDRDKVVYCALLTDPLDEAPETRGIWDTRQLMRTLVGRMREIDTYIATSVPEPPNEVLHLVLFQGLGRPYSVALTKGFAKPCFPSTVFCASDLETIATLKAGNPLLMRQYALAEEALSDSARIITTGPLDTFSLFESNGGFYLSDDARPTHVCVTPGSGGELRRKSKLRMDRHQAPSYLPNRLVEVFRLDEGVPIYGSFSMPGTSDQDMALLVEGYAIPMWVVVPRGREDTTYRVIYFQLVQMLAYWLWQFTAGIEKYIGALATAGLQSVSFHVHLYEDSAWFNEDGPASPDDRCDVSFDGPGTIILSLGAGFGRRFRSADNSGERLVVAELLGAVAQLYERQTSEKCDLHDAAFVDGLVTTHAPLGQKKKLLMLTGGSNPRLVRDGLPEFRQVQAAEEQRLLDDIGEFVRSGLGCCTGPIPDTDRPRVLNAVVAYLYRRLECLVATLSPHGLLEELVALNERMVYEEAFARLVAPTRAACYYSQAEMAQRFQQEYQDRAEAHVASRFLLEYVSACPPRGARPFSLSIYDELMALCAQITMLGEISDAITYDLSDRKLHVLASGRVAFGQGSYDSAHGVFIEEFSHDLVAQSVDGFAAHWSERNARAKDAAAEFNERVDEATQAEFGITYSRLIDFLVGLFGLGIDDGMGPHVLLVDDLLRDLQITLKWHREEVRAAFDFFAAGRRSSFLSPPKPYERYDVFPWRHNRSLSYFRKPLLVRPSAAGEEVVWGNRLLTLAIEYLGHLCHGGHLKARTHKMRQLQGEIHQRDGEAFNDAVAAVFRLCPNFIVRTRVQKVGSRRLLRPNGDSLGDIDVLVAIPKERTMPP